MDSQVTRGAGVDALMVPFGRVVALQYLLKTNYHALTIHPNIDQE